MNKASVVDQQVWPWPPASWVILIAKQYNLDLNYIVFGEKYADKMRKDDENMNIFIKNFIQNKYDFEFEDSDYALKALSGEVEFMIKRFLDYIKN